MIILFLLWWTNRISCR